MSWIGRGIWNTILRGRLAIFNKDCCIPMLLVVTVRPCAGPCPSSAPLFLLCATKEWFPESLSSYVSSWTWSVGSICWRVGTRRRKRAGYFSSSLPLLHGILQSPNIPEIWESLDLIPPPPFLTSSSLGFSLKKEGASNHTVAYHLLWFLRTFSFEIGIPSSKFHLMGEQIVLLIQFISNALYWMHIFH